MKIIKIFFYSITFLYHLYALSATNILFSNNSEDSFRLISESAQGRQISIVGTGSLDVDVGPFLSNITTFNIPSVLQEPAESEHEFHILIENKRFPYQSVMIELLIKKNQEGYEIANGKISLPFDEVNFDPKIFFSIDISKIWPNRILRFVPSKVYKNGLMWASLVIVVDTKESEETLFDNHTANTFKIMNYNVQIWPFYGDLAVPSNKKLVRARAIPKFIGNSFDYIALNEVFDPDIRRKIKNDMKKTYQYFVDVGGIDSVNFLSSGILVFSKWPIIKYKHYTYQNCYDIECLGAKGVTYTKIKKQIGGQDSYYHVFATHMQSKYPSDHRPAHQFPRPKQLRELADFIHAQNISNIEPIIILGDFNIDAFDANAHFYDGINSQTEYEFMLQILNASDSTHSGVQYSFDAFLNTMLSLASSNERVKIDHILYNKGHLKPIYSRNKIILLRDTENPVMYPNYDLSDHFPIIGEFVFPQGESL